MLTFKTEDATGHLKVVDQYGSLGSIWEVTEADIVEWAAKEGMSAEDVGWHFDISAPRLTTRFGGPFKTVQEVIKAVQDTYDEFAVDWAKERTFDHRHGQRVISIPSGGQRRK